MYYEEQWTEGALCWRTSPDGAWTRYTANELAHRYESAEKRAADAQATVEALRAQRDEQMRTWWTLRGVEVPCVKCDGAGWRSYASTATWRGGIGGQAITSDVCDECWGSGDMHKKGTNLRKMRQQVEALQREYSQLQALVRALPVVRIDLNGVYHGTQGTSMRIDLSPKIKDDGGYGEHF